MIRTPDFPIVETKQGKFSPIIPYMGGLTAWLSFMRDGNPSTSELIWEPYTEEKPQLMYLDENSGLRMEKDRELLFAITSCVKERTKNMYDFLPSLYFIYKKYVKY